MHIRQAAQCLMISCICLNFNNAMARDNSTEQAPFASAYAALEQKDHKKALELFNAAAREFPDSAHAHYGRALSLNELGRKEEAIKEFKLTLLLNAPEQIGKNCKEKISVLEGAKHPVHNSAPACPAPTTVQPQDVESSINKILKQSEEKIGSVKASADAYADRVYSSRADAHSKLMEQSRQEAEEMRRARFVFGRHSVPLFSDAEIMQRQAEIQYKSISALDRAKADYQTRKQEAQARALSIKESAEGLESQMLSKPSDTSGVFLVPQGTNLYVRNYGHFDPVFPEPPEALHAVPLKMPSLMQKSLKPGKKEIIENKSNSTEPAQDEAI